MSKRFRLCQESS